MVKFGITKQYITQGGSFPAYYKILAGGGHVLIAGATGSGKSVLINNIIKFVTCTQPPSGAGFILIDTKKIELIDWREDPHTSIYADTHNKVTHALKRANTEMYKRFKTMKSEHLKKYEGTQLYIIIDELADLYINYKEAAKELDTIATLGRAAGITIIAGTQRPTRDIIRPLVSVNFIHKIALHTNSKRDSINILGAAGAEELPYFGYGIIQTPNHEIQTIKIDRL